MMKTKKGYSLIVLAIAITVILILVSSAVSVLQVSREKTKITNFIFDITTVEEKIQDFYISTGTLPITSNRSLDMMADVNNNGSEGIISQLYVYDNEKYYDVDLSQLGTISLKDSERGYIVNEGSLKVYVRNGIEYEGIEDSNSTTTYYTLTSTLVNGLEQYTSQDEEVLIIGNPVTWAENANLRVILPRKSLEAVGADSWSDWEFKWDFGPKTKEELEAIPDSDNVRNFAYGDLLNVKSNGIYSIYVKDPNDNVTTVNVNVTKIDDISPTYKIITNSNGNNVQAIDNETGIKTIKYKTVKNYNDNVASASDAPSEDLEGRTNIDFYLIDGIGKDLIYNLAAEIDAYISERKIIQTALDEENGRYTRWQEENDMQLFTEEEKQNEKNRHDTLISELNLQMTALQQKYPYLFDIDGTTDDSRLILYIEDYAGNATIAGLNDAISTRVLANSYNISLEGLE